MLPAGRGRNLDELRDIQVLLADISEFIHDVPELNVFREYLQKKERKLLHDARKEIRSIKTGALSSRVEKVERMTELLPVQGLKENLYEALDDTFARVLRYYSALDVEKPTTIHRLRIAFKKFRYMVEIVHPLLKGFPSGNFQKMHDYQSMMGDIQDMEVAVQKLGDLIDQDPAASLETAHFHYAARLKQSLFNYLEDKGELLTFWRTLPDQSFPWET